MPKRNNGPNINSLNSNNHILKRGRPATPTPNPPILDVPNSKPVPHKHFSKRPPKFKPIPLMPKPTVDDNNTTTRHTVGKVELTELTGMLTVSNKLHR